MKYRIGIDLGGTNIAVGLVREDYQILSVRTAKTQREKKEEEIINQIAFCTEELLQKNHLSMEDISSIGIGVPGSANKETGVIEFANNLSFGNVAFAPMLSNRLKKKINFDNDANAAAWGEYLAGVGKGRKVKSLAAITIGTGIGGGFIIDGRIQQGVNYASAEFGHMVIDRNGIECNCGRKGCLEAYASATALIHQTKQAMKTNSSSILWELCCHDLNQVEGKTIFDAIKREDVLAKEVFSQYISYLGTGVVNIINIFQPDILCIGGGISNVKEILLDPLKAIVAKESYARESKKQTDLCIAALNNEAGIIGAAFLE